MREIPVHERRLAIIASNEEMQRLSNKIDYKKILKLYYNPIFYAQAVKENFKRINSIEKFKNSLKSELEYITKGTPYKLNPLLVKNLPYNLFEINEARELFNFPPQHPKDGTMYACCDMEPNLYVPMSDFHRYMYQSKMSAFQEMCASLGAKECKVKYAEIDNVDVTSDFKASEIPTNIGNVSEEIKFTMKGKSGESANVTFSFPKPLNGIEEYQSGWLYGEPSWVSLQKIRLERDVEKYTADFSYIDEMGITVKSATAIQKTKIDIGGTFNKIIKRKFSFEVTFWPKE